MTTKRTLIYWNYRVMNALVGIPMGHDSTGTKTISVEGMYAYQRDMREFKNLFSQYSYVLTDNDFSEAERLLVAMENHSAECKRKAT